MGLPLGLKIRLYALAGMGVLGFIGVIIASIGMMMFMAFMAMCLAFVAVDRATASTENVTAQSHTWKRTINVEIKKIGTDEDWCEDVPTNAKILSRTSKKKSSTRRTKTYSDWCEYEVEKWYVGRDLVAEGTGITPSPAWPALDFTACDQLGCEREGKKKETYTLLAKRTDGSDQKCDIDEPVWASIADNSVAHLNYGGITGMAECDTLASGGAVSK